MYNIVSSLVIYNNDRTQLIEAIESFLNTALKVKLILIDHSPNDNLRDIKIDDRIEYIHNPLNPGFGAGHNFTIKKYINETSYFLILNPDIYYSSGVIEDIITFMNKDQSIGLLMPKIIYPNGKIQYVAKLIPSPFNFLIKRLLPKSKLKERLLENFELRISGYDTTMDVPYISGCFMVFKSEVLKKLNGFDENIFMHMEDLDISRRCLNAGYRNVFYPKATVIHDHLYKPMTSFKNLKMYLKSANYYFNKWGWVFDKNRKTINRATLQQFKVKD